MFYEAPLQRDDKTLAMQYWTAADHEILQDESEGPFRCDHCVFASADATRCSHEVIVQKYQGVIAPAKCCDFFNKKR